MTTNKGRCRHPICKEARMEVAREIFEEIKSICTLYAGFNNKHLFAHIDFEKLAELKKKYTEDLE